MKLALALLVAGGLTYQTGSTTVGATVGVAAYLLTSWRLVRDEVAKLRRRDRWWSHANLVAAFTVAGILPPTKPDQPPHILGFQGKPQDDATGGTTVGIVLPLGYTFAKVRDNREKLASALNIPAARLDLSQKRGDRARVVRIWVGTTERGHRTAPIATAQHGQWADPALVGTDDRGRDIHLTTTGTHTAFIGGTGSGKTWTGRVFVAPAILDPTVHIDAIIAKDNLNDWRPMAPRCGTYIGGATKDAVQRVERLLQEVEADAEERQSQDNPPPRILVVEEWYRVRLAANRADQQLAKRLDSLMGELLATTRSANIHIIMLAQRGTVEYLPGDQKANLMQRLVGKTGSEAEVRYVMDDRKPQLYPAQPGEFLVSTDERDPVLVRVDQLTDRQFVDLCRRAPRRQSPATRQLEATTVEQPAATVSPLEAVVVDVLRSAGGSLSPTLLLAAVQATGVETNATALGRALAGMGSVEKGKTAEGRFVRLSESGRRETVSETLS